MERRNIPFGEFALPIMRSFGDRWMLLTAGKNRPGGFNVMTISWGALGFIWDKPLAMVVVRPSRYTYAFMEKSDSFTLCAFPEEYREKLNLCGTQSGRYLDKVRACAFTPIASTIVDAPGFDEAELIIECRKMYYDDLEPAHFLADHIESNYGGRNYHRMYFGEIVAVRGSEAYCRVP